MDFYTFWIAAVVLMFVFGAIAYSLDEQSSVRPVFVGLGIVCRLAVFVCFLGWVLNLLF